MGESRSDPPGDLPAAAAHPSGEGPDEAAKELAATREILRAISLSPSDAQPVLDIVARSAAQLCDARFCHVFRLEGGLLHFAAHHGLAKAGVEAVRRSWPRAPDRGSAAGRSILSGAVEQIPDVFADADYALSETAKMADFRSTVGVPMLRNRSAIGAITVSRRRVGTFSERKIELLSTFAEQAAIAIENVRLFDEVQARTRNLEEALEQQTATSEVLQVISNSPGELEPVFEAMLSNAIRISDAKFANLFLCEGDGFRAAAVQGEQAYVESWKSEPRVTVRDAPGGPLDMLSTSKGVVHVPDAAAMEAYRRNRRLRSLVETAGARTLLGVPMVKENELVGAIIIYRQDVRPFSKEQINLVRNFADQAVIAIENARLFDEVNTRTAELSEALQQQTATTDVLKLISRSTFDLQTVLDTLTRSAASLCEADMSTIYRPRGDAFYWASSYGYAPELVDYMRTYPMKPGRGTAVARVLADGATIQVLDVLADPDYVNLEAQKLGDYRTLLAVPLLREGTPIGVIALARRTVRPFTDKQIELVTTFADQSVIAIENTRLLNELQASLEQQTATSEVLKTISRSAFNLRTVLDALIESAARLCEADISFVARYVGDTFRHAADYGAPPEYRAYLERYPIPIGRSSVAGRVLLEGKIIHVPDVMAESVYEMTVWAKLGGVHTLLGVPLMREGTPIGAMVLQRKAVRPFTPNQIELVETFADQAVIAIENARLFEEVQARNREVTEALEQQTATSNVLKVISRSAFDLQTVLDTLVESATRLCGADKGNIMHRDGDVYRWSAHFGHEREFIEYIKVHPFAPGRGTVTSRVALEGKTVHVHDTHSDPEYEDRELLKLGSGRTVLGVPLLREGVPVGAFTLVRAEVCPFTPRQIELVETFADQAVIAIENVRLFEEVQARTTELSESLEQQTATSEILRVISTSPTEVQPVYEAIVRKAVSLCDSLFANIFRFDGEMVQFVATCNAAPEYEALLKLKHPMRPDSSDVSGRVLRDKSVVWIEDVYNDHEHAAQFPPILDCRRMLGVPMLRKGEPVGVIVVGWKNPGPALKAPEDLLKTFADQAVIAVENARLFEEVQARTASLSEALRRQTATADVLKAISRSAFDLKNVLHTLLQSAVTLCDAERGTITRQIDGVFYRTEGYGHSQQFMDYVKGVPVTADAGSITGRAMLEKRVVHIPDVDADPLYTFSPEARKIDTYRAMLGVPMMREGVPLGVLALTRSEPRAFTEKEIELVSTFADQAAIAIENARLFSEVQTRTEELSRSLEDLRTTQDRLVQTEKLASLGQLTAGIAHEIKNPLNFVNNFSSLSVELIDELTAALSDTGMPPEKRSEIDELADMLRGNFQKVVEHGRRADSIVKNMLLHSRQGSGEHRLADINAIVEESLNLAYHGARAEKQNFNISLEKSLDPEAGEVDLYPQEITRVLLNLISNGFYAAMKRRDQVDGADYEPTLSATTSNLGDSVEIRIRDNGTGIPPDARDKLFSPFFTTKPVGEGTGLGLSLSHDIVVQQHAGSIEVESELGAFTEFRIVLPRAAASLGESGGRP